MSDMRIMVFDRLDSYLFDIDMAQVVSAKYTSAINGEHSLTIETSQELEKTNRLLVRDGMGIWHEYVVVGIEETHDGKEYYCVWSLQYDLSGTFINGPYDCGIVPGHASVPQLPHTAMGVALGGTERWVVGTITVTSMAAASFYRRSGWEGLQTVVNKWGGELQATITVGQDCVVTRAADLLAHVGSSNATRRFDYGHDLKSIKRTTSDDVWPCRIVPLGKSQETGNGGYTRRPSIESVNGGVMWLQDDGVVPYVRVLNPDGEWEYPTVIVVNDTYEQPADLKAWAVEHLSEYTRPKVTYEAGVVQFERAGLNPHGVALGDDVIAVDRTFGADGLRITARVTKITGSLLDPTATTLTIGNIGESLTDHLSGMSRQLGQLADTVERSQQFQATAEYVSNLLGRLNSEVNATGGYTYITEGEGIRTYDVPVSDPLVGSEASMVVEIRGGNIRIANSRTSGGDWDFKTLIQSGHIAASLVTAANITTGFIGNQAGSYWDLDGNRLVIASGSSLGDRTVQEVLDGVDSTITNVDVQYAQNTSPTQAPTTGWSTTAPAWESGKYIWSRTATTAGGATTYSTPVMISGRDGANGQDGTSVTILGSYETLAQLQAAHPIGSDGDAYMVGGDLYVWNGSAWEDVGQIQGPQGTPGADGADGANGSQIWTATANPTTPNYTFAISSLSGPSGVTPQVGDIVVRSYYRYTITSVGATSVLTGSRTSIRGAAGANGTSVTVSSIQYGVSSSAGTQPTSWSATAPTSITQGKWLWVKTTYSDDSTATTKSYVGTDGEDGTSVFVQSSSKSGDTTTIVIADSDGHTNTITIKDGEDGTDGTAGANGLNGYVHVAWANSEDGATDFSTNVSTGKRYIGVYSDNTAADSQRYTDYSWSLIRGADGDNGIGLSLIVEEYYLSTSSSTQVGGEWSTSQPAWESGKYIWTRSNITWDDGVTTVTTPVLAKAINSANKNASDAMDMADEAARVATNYLDFNAATGLDIGYSGTSAKTRVSGSGVEVFDGNGLSAFFAGIQSNKSLVRIGYSNGPARIDVSGDGYVDIRSATTIIAHFGYGTTWRGDVQANGTYYTLGTRAANSRIGWGSLAHGSGNTASGTSSFASGTDTQATGGNAHSEGYYTTASGTYSHVEGYYSAASGDYSHAEGNKNTASGSGSHAEGRESVASGDYSHASGDHAVAASTGQTAVGLYNVESNYSPSDTRHQPFIVGRGSSNGRSNALYVTMLGNLWIAGSLTQNSDRRLKEHHAYLADDAVCFVRKLKPALYSKDGERHTGFYAQDVQDAEPDGWDTATVTSQHTDESLDYDPLTLDYTALIAPLTAYAQHLERRIEELERLVGKGQR